uniref:Uncharacterized protein n=1 Tax=Anguilla anguilla TaxID=7936 RepID=A0A0E9U4L9_ANGAN
MVPIIRLLI